MLLNRHAHIPNSHAGTAIIGGSVVDLRETELRKTTDEYIKYIEKHTGKPLKEIKLIELLSKLEQFLESNAPNLNIACVRAELGKKQNAMIYKDTH